MHMPVLRTRNVIHKSLIFEILQDSENNSSECSFGNKSFEVFGNVNKEDDMSLNPTIFQNFVRFPEDDILIIRFKEHEKKNISNPPRVFIECGRPKIRRSRQTPPVNAYSIIFIAVAMDRHCAKRKKRNES
ncbi:hypothetical protein CRE_02181 [Caenorhabditis remanei]|uniref:Uncharacterized protein n=1 Tax=Caenorhabditis remanei TaxID=31234 RepID=E3LFI3_CAERE|nr:hypothetical protein CRE_02181 [Caenorhabditis remanei]